MGPDICIHEKPGIELFAKSRLNLTSCKTSEALSLYSLIVGCGYRRR